MKQHLVFCIVVLALVPAAPAGAASEWIGGWEGSADRGYSFISPVLTLRDTPARALLLRASASYLYYALPEAGGETDVTSPGVALGVAYRKKLRRGSITFGPGYEVRDTQRTRGAFTESEREQGFTFQGDIFYQPAPLDTWFAIGSYGQANQYVWSRGGYKRQVTNRTFQGPRALGIGVELTAQGNEDLRALQGGGFLDLSFLRSATSLQFRAGYSDTEYDTGETTSEPYFGIGFYRRF